jgi:regulator of replication initiation timing
MTLQEIKTEYQTIIDELIEKNKKLKDENKKLNAQLDKYVK